jgi:hypothetical protein
MGLLLEAVDVGGPLAWRWLLRDEESGNSLADQLVRLDPKSTTSSASAIFTDTSTNTPRRTGGPRTGRGSSA